MHNNICTPLFQISGIVVHGKGEGRLLGYPTINIAYAGTFICPKGVYAACARSARHDGGEPHPFLGAAVVGGDFIESEKPKVEMFLFLDTDVDWYGTEIIIEFLGFISELQKISTHQDLIKKIESDVAAVKEFFTVCLPE